MEAVDDATCVFVTGSDSIDGLAVHLSLLGLDFTVSEPPELVEHLRTLAERYARGAATMTHFSS